MRMVPPDELVKAAKDWIKAGGKAKNPWDVDGFRLPGGPVYSKAGMMTFPAANAIYRRETYDNYPTSRSRSRRAASRRSCAPLRRPP
jgi:3-hydroxyacyl-CoA dehydrogenase/enoyl-CoA hydratase/3-hydroxybutyryl-CoA epimerase